MVLFLWKIGVDIQARCSLRKVWISYDVYVWNPLRKERFYSKWALGNSRQTSWLKPAYQISLVGPKWLAELGWGLLAALTCLTVVGCSLFWARVVDPTEINELHIFPRQDRLSTDISSKNFRGNPIDVQEQHPTFYWLDQEGVWMARVCVGPNAGEANKRIQYAHALASAPSPTLTRLQYSAGNI